MHVSIRRYPKRAGYLDQLRRHLDEGFVPIISRQPGFVAYYGVIPGDGTAVSVTVFRDRWGAEDSIRAAADYVRESLVALLPSPPEIVAGEVLTAKTG